MTGNLTCTGKPTESVMISMYVTKGVCQIMSDTDWNPRLNALIQLGFTYSDIVLLSTLDPEGKQDPRYAIACTFAPLITALEAFLIVFNWTNENGVLMSPLHSALSSSDLVALINNTRKAIVERLS